MRKEVYPKNKQLFKKLIPFAKRIISICKENNISLVIYGSFAHFYHTKDKNMKVSDIDVYVPEDSFEKIIRVLKQKKINYKYIPKWHILRIEKGKLKVELDSIDFWYKDTNNKSLPRNFNKINFYGIETEVIALKNLVAVYLSAYKGSTDNKERIIKKIKHLEKFLRRELKSEINVEIKKNKNLKKSQKDFINKNRVKEFGKKEKKDFKKDYEPETSWFFVKKENKIVAFGGLRPIKIKYLGKTYNILGICSIISVKKRKGYGKILMSFMVDYSKKTGKTLLGFTEKTEFFRKAGLGTKKDFIKRFVYLNPKTGKIEIDNDGDGVYYNGKDNFIKEVLLTKSIVYIDVMHW